MKWNAILKLNWIDDIRKVINNWQYRFLTPIGRNCIAKSLLIPKLAHLAIIIPSLNAARIKKVENIIFSFIWKGRDKCAQEVAKLPELKGLLNFPDIKNHGCLLNYHV